VTQTGACKLCRHVAEARQPLLHVKELALIGSLLPAVAGIAWQVLRRRRRLQQKLPLQRVKTAAPPRQGVLQQHDPSVAGCGGAAICES
jgi:hypothetical protein